MTPNGYSTNGTRSYTMRLTS